MTSHIGACLGRVAAVAFLLTALAPAAAKPPPRDRIDLGDKPDVRCVALSPDGKTLAVVCYQDVVRLWDVATLKQVAALKPEGWNGSGHVEFTPDGGLAVDGGARVTEDGKEVPRWMVRVLDVATGKERQAVLMPKEGGDAGS